MAKGKAAKTPDGRDLREPADALFLLKADHEDIRALFADYEKRKDTMSPGQKRELVHGLYRALITHSTAESQIFYPLVREALDDGPALADAAEEEHRTIDDMIKALKDARPEEPGFDHKVKVLGEYVEHHIEREEEVMFPPLRHSALDLLALAARLVLCKAHIMTELGAEHPAAAATH